MAMRTGEPVHAAGGVSRNLLENIEEFQRAWTLLCPHLFKPAKITAEEELPETPRPDTAVIAYSGGVDANSSLAFHLEGHAGRRRRNIEAAVLIHGMDVPLHQDFSYIQDCARTTLKNYDIPLSTIRTNWREFNKNWEMVFVAGIAGCLHHFDTGYGLISSDEDYGSIVMPWSSNPATNHFLSGTRAIQTEGAGFTRTQKVGMLSPAMSSNLRVCWRNFENSAQLNCGRCEKCTRTKMNFAANNIKPPACLGAELTALDGLRPWAKNRVQQNYLKDALRNARQNKVDDGWVRTLPVGLFLSQVLIPFYPAARALRNTLRAAARPKGS